MAENQSPTVADRFKMPDIYDSGMRGANGKSPEQRAKDAQAADEQKKKDKLKKKLKPGLDDDGDEEEEQPKKKKKGGFVLIPHSTYQKHFGSKKKAKK